MFDYTMKIIHMNLVIFTFYFGFFSLLPNYFSHPSLVIYFSPNPPIKVSLGLQRGGRLLNSNSKPP
jgi:hypothetical protein